MKQVKFIGVGQLNGPVSINKTILLEDQVAYSLSGPKRDEVKVAILAVHYPSVKINPKMISVNVSDYKRESKKG